MKRAISTAIILATIATSGFTPMVAHAFLYEFVGGWTDALAATRAARKAAEAEREGERIARVLLERDRTVRELEAMRRADQARATAEIRRLDGQVKALQAKLQSPRGKSRLAEAISDEKETAKGPKLGDSQRKTGGRTSNSAD